MEPKPSDMCESTSAGLGVNAIVIKVCIPINKELTETLMMVEITRGRQYILVGVFYVEKECGWTSISYRPAFLIAKRRRAAP